ncbi:MAG: HAD-IIA family hydrolase [Chloroflexi bacterium]|nr:HAD-IIA family hydrolase [Chloroflexota bacterium]
MPTGVQLVDLACVLVDLDGVVYRGRDVIPGAPDFFPLARRLGLGLQVITNNSSQTPEEYVDKLAGYGIDVTPEEVLTSGEAAARYLEERAPKAKTFVIGESGLRQALMRRGFEIDAGRPDFVVVGIDRQFTYEKLKTAATAILDGAQFIATNPDTQLPTETGLMPGTGSIVAAVAAASGTEPIFMGKPKPYLCELALRRFACPPHLSAMIGDRLDTDVASGIAAGTTTVLVLSGISTSADLETAAPEERPDYVFSDLAAFGSALADARAGTA